MTRPPLPRGESNVAAAPVERPYKYVAKTETRRDRVLKLLAAIDVTHPDDARMVLAMRLLNLYRDSPPVGYASVPEDKKWRAGNVTRHPSYVMHWFEAKDLWSKQGSAAEEDIRTFLLCRIFYSLSPNRKAQLVAEFKRLR
jgi:hypothetical protein